MSCMVYTNLFSIALHIGASEPRGGGPLKSIYVSADQCLEQKKKVDTYHSASGIVRNPDALRSPMCSSQDFTVTGPLG
jgi:hypothetical protein